MELDGTEINLALSIMPTGSPQMERPILSSIKREILDRKTSDEGEQEVHPRVEAEVKVGVTELVKTHNRFREKIKDRQMVSGQSPTEPVKGTGKILFMDDDELLRELVPQMLSLLGYEAVTARDGQEAVHLYTRSKNSAQAFDAVIVDLTVPGGLGGKEAVQLLREADPNVRAILATGSSNDPVMQDFKKYGFVAAVTKPYTMKELSRVLEEVLAAECHGDAG